MYRQKSEPPQVFTREELYERVWTVSARRLAAELGISDVMLGKICRAHRIPKPSPGYWAKVQHGASPKKKRLPSCSDPALQTITIRSRAREGDAEAAMDEKFDPDIRDVLSKALVLPPIELPETLRGLHPLVRAAKRMLDGQEPDPPVSRGRGRRAEPVPAPTFGVSSRNQRRALRLADALVRAIEAVGGRLCWQHHEWGRDRGRTVVEFCGEAVCGLHIDETYSPAEIEGGLLAICDGRDRDGRLCWDTPVRRKLETQLNDLLVRLVRRAGRQRRERRAREERQRRWERRERVMRLRRQELERRQGEWKSRQEAESAKIDRLLAEVEGWRRSREIRGYVAALESAFVTRHGPIDPASECGQWLQWARSQADGMDPLAPCPASVLDEPMPQLSDIPFPDEEA